ncbi:MAG: amidohydrolase [Desulfobacterales bacterium]|nr:amidohydrolase [Desulfobacterales bacterium]
MNENQLKQEIYNAIDTHKEQIIDLGKTLYDHPELGYKEVFGTQLVGEFFKKIDMDVTESIAVTGISAAPTKKQSGPTITVMGELDAIVCADHPKAKGDEKAVHACGHPNQIAAMAGVALGLHKAGAFDKLHGNIQFMAVPAEEFIQMDFRSYLKKKGKIHWYGGKQEMIRRGLFDTTDMAMMIHSLDLGSVPAALLGATGNGFIGKEIHFKGRASHAGAAPHDGVNALNAAMLAMNNIHAQRETFRDEDHIRVHPILTKGGDAVNVVPADVRMESYVRGASIDGMRDASKKVDRAIMAGAMAVGADVEIKTTAGYLPLLSEPGLNAIFKENIKPFCGEMILENLELAGSFDMGDLSHLIPCLHPFISGVSGNLHTQEFKVADMETACIMPAKAMAGTLVDLLSNGAKKANTIIDRFLPRLSKETYLTLLNDISECRHLNGEKMK